MNSTLMPPQPELKPFGVNIIHISAMALQTNMGTPALLILGLGDNNVIYKYYGPKQEWQVQE